jgi:hypothetical protein
VTDAQSRAAELLRLAAQYLRDNANTTILIAYDETECDGSCLADDCEFAAEALEA